MAITLTQAAASRINEYLAKRGKGVGLRLGVKKTGCSGWAYAVDYADSVNAEDTVFDDRGIKVVVKTQDLDFLNGTQVDFSRDGLNAAFSFKNPNAKDECGCGESFTV